jgi:opacity protein-like surface antigen
VATLNSACSTGHIGDTTPFNVAAFPVPSDISQKLNWFRTVRGRIGPTVTPTVLVYVTGGLAYGEITTTNTVASTNITGSQGTNVFTLTPVAGSASSTTTRVGWTIGAGIEGVVSGNWTAKLEYLYVAQRRLANQPIQLAYYRQHSAGRPELPLGGPVVRKAGCRRMRHRWLLSAGLVGCPQ